MTVKSKYIASVPVPAYDPRVTEAIDYPMEGGGKDMRIAVETPDGQVYRVVQTTGLGAFMYTINRLLDLGFKDLLADKESAVGGFDARMHPGSVLPEPPQTESEASSLESDLQDILQGNETERLAFVAARIGQGAFRAGVIAHWGACAVTGANCIALLRASHIKPWRNSNNLERLDPANGLLLSPNLDAAFDAGYTSFADTGKILISERASGKIAYDLHINPRMRLNAKLLTEAHRMYLQEHREAVFLG